MTPERAAEVLRALLGSMSSWIEEVESFQEKCPEAAHLVQQLKQSKLSLEQILARSVD